ncbi:MAG TPA: malto-oligosyltrehalose synthase [Gammaproteobacteria bacterium]|nr:malto-oligosyltrehalose synthase [Gammaproteobacteria bacterium]
MASDPLPRATYRLQLTEQYGFKAAAALVPYLEKLGISHAYLSPYLKTRPHSTHGYDVIDHSKLNPELGDQADYDHLCRTLAEHGLFQLLDIVPNHIGIMGSDNQWWLDVLENGQASRFADYFDIDWQPVKPELADKVMVPVLGAHYGNALVNGELHLVFDASAGEFSVYYYQHRLPLDPATYPRILHRKIGGLAVRRARDDPELIELESIIRALRNLPPHSQSDGVSRRVRTHEEIIAKRRLAELCAASEPIARHVAENVEAFNGNPGIGSSFEELHELLEQQAYRVAYWRVAADEINYRRFFDINDLAGLQTQNEEVFEATHRQLLAWVAEGRIHGFRIDHPDGLFDPRGYLQWLRGKLTDLGHADHYMVVEKILAAHEHLPEDWPVQGTTGYDFSFALNGLFVYSPAEHELDRTYSGFIRRQIDFDELLHTAKLEIVTFHLSSELTVLANLLDRLAEARLATRDFTQSSLRSALLELVAAFPVYRTYIAHGEVSAQDKQYIDWAVNHARRRYGHRDEGVFEYMRGLLMPELPSDATEEYRLGVERFCGKFQQLTAPAMAKALEDTCFYRYVRLLSLNEVGGEPVRFGLTPAAFHRLSQLRLQHWPHTMLGTSTHDSKRSEDVRARINVLSELPESWRAKLAKWRRFNSSRRRLVGDESVPSRNEEYLFYQTLVGTWPVLGGQAELPAYRKRLEGYMLKALREAKTTTSWTNPDEEYEAAVLQFVGDVLTASPRNRFLGDLDEFVHGLATAGFLNGLSQTLLKLTSPGVPDIYQGTELWDFSLVDPDNRRPVDYGLRQRLLARLEQDCAAPEPVDGLLEDMLRTLEDGRAKLYLIWRCLNFRKSHDALFDEGTYLPLDVLGSREQHLLGFARQHGDQTVVVAAGRWFVSLMERPDAWPGTPFLWGDTQLLLPGAGTYRHLFSGETFVVDGDPSAIAAERLFARFPAALLVLRQR